MDIYGHQLTSREWTVGVLLHSMRFSPEILDIFTSFSSTSSSSPSLVYPSSSSSSSPSPPSSSSASSSSPSIHHLLSPFSSPLICAISVYLLLHTHLLPLLLLPLFQLHLLSHFSREFWSLSSSSPSPLSLFLSLSFSVFISFSYLFFACFSFLFSAKEVHEGFGGVWSGIPCGGRVCSHGSEWMDVNRENGERERKRGERKNG